MGLTITLLTQRGNDLAKHELLRPTFEICFSTEHRQERLHFTPSPLHLSPSKTNLNSDGLERLTLQNKPLTACFLSLGQLTCWSLEPGAPQCGPLDPCRVRTGRSLWRPEAPRSCPGSWETGTWCQFCRCWRRWDLKERTHVGVLCFSFCESFSRFETQRGQGQLEETAPFCVREKLNVPALSRVCFEPAASSAYIIKHPSGWRETSSASVSAIWSAQPVSYLE